MIDELLKFFFFFDTRRRRMMKEEMAVMFRQTATSMSISVSSSISPPSKAKALEEVAVARSMSASSASRIQISTENRKLPVLLFDVMDTLVRDPFYHDVPAFFRTNFSELIKDKHPTSWLEFENGLINEEEFGKKFFSDGRHVDIEGLKGCMQNGYHYLDGIETLLQYLKQKNFEMHAFTNYPIWYTLVEDKLKLSTYLSWTFCSCNLGKRKPAPELFLEVSDHLRVEPANCIFIDDRLTNVEAARNAGMIGLHFRNAISLQEELSMHGIEIHRSVEE